MFLDLSLEQDWVMEVLFLKKWMPDILPVISRTVCFVKLVKLWHILSVSVGACAHVSIGACVHVPITRVVPRRNAIRLCI